jgi:hypothetical protein
VLAPPQTFTGARLYDALAPLAQEDERYGWALAHFCASLATALDLPADLSRDQEDGTPGYGVLFQLDRLTGPLASLLPYVGQFVGVQGLVGVTDDEKRFAIGSTSGFSRGRPAAILAAARATLTGAKRAHLIERTGSAYRFAVTVVADDCPDLPTTTAAVAAQTPGGLVGTVSTVVGGDYATLHDAHADYAEVHTDFATYADVEADPSHT